MRQNLEYQKNLRNMTKLIWKLQKTWKYNANLKPIQRKILTKVKKKKKKYKT